MNHYVYLIRTQALRLPDLAKFGIGMAVIVGIPPLSHRVRLPAVVGLLLGGVVIGPHGLGLFGEKRPIADFLAELGKLLLMFFAGLEIDLTHFRSAKNRSAAFGVVTTAIPLLLGTAVALQCGYRLVAAIAIGSLLASHTLLGSSIVSHLGLSRREPITVAIGATVLSDTLSLVVFAICVSTYHSGWSIFSLTLQLVEIAVFVPFILVGLSRMGSHVLGRVENDENAYFVLMFGMMAAAGVIAQAINLPGIVGSFLAGLSVNNAVHNHPARAKLEFFGNSFFVPIFFIATGFLVDPRLFIAGIITNFRAVTGIIGALLIGKWIAAEAAGRVFGYSPDTRLTMWSLTIPQVAATLAAALVAFHTFNAAGQPLIDRQMIDVVLVLMLTTSIMGPVLTQRFAPRMLLAAAAASPEPAVTQS